MKVYCPNCGQANETGPGARVMCTACTAVFDAPPEAGAPPPAPPPPDQGWSPPPPAPEYSPPPADQSWNQPAPPPAYAPPAQPSWPAPTYGTPANMGAAQVTNTLAIISLIAGVVCCIPVVSPLTAIVTGAIAISQINADPVTQKGKGLAVAGIVLGSLSVVLSLLSLLSNFANAASSY